MDKTFIIFNIYELYRLRTRYIIKHMQDTLGEQDTELYFLTNALAGTLQPSVLSAHSRRRMHTYVPLRAAA